MAIVVTMTMSQGRRDRLISLRNGFTYASNLFALVIAIIFILTVDDQIWTFRFLAWTLTIIGVPLSTFFITFIPEVRLTKEAIVFDKEYRKINGEVGEENEDKENEAEENEDKENEAEENEDKDNENKENEVQNTWRDWLTSGTFYVYAAVYTFTRMAVNVTMTLTPFYLIHVLEFSAKQGKPAPPQIATVPLVSYA